jgi:hypothetical protein
LATLTALQAYQAIQDHAAKKAAKAVRLSGLRMEVGQGGRQGDIYIWRVDENHPRGKRVESRQLALGVTQGSRHMAVGEDVEVYEGVKAPDFLKATDAQWRSVEIPIGPLIVVKGERFVGEHPEHAHYLLAPGTYQVTHQIDARTLQRVLD